MSLRRLGRLALALAVLPHELGHALPTTLVRVPYSITLLPEWKGRARPLGRFDADIDATTPAWVIRAIAVAPLPLYVGLAALLRVTALPRPAAVVVFLLCSYWATLSGGDLAVAARPDEVQSAGNFLVTTAGWEAPASDLLTVATVLLVAVVSFG